MFWTSFWAKNTRKRMFIFLFVMFLLAYAYSDFELSKKISLVFN